MKTPLKLPAREFKGLATVKELFPVGSYIHSFLMYNGDIEVPLSADGRYVIAHTNKYTIYEFWTCLSRNAEQVQRVATHFDNIEDHNIFHLLQETLPNHPDPFLRAGIFFLLNKYSKSGYVSQGEFNRDSYNPLAMANLRRVSFDNLMVTYDKGEDIVENIKNISVRCDYVFFPIGHFSLGYLKNKENDSNSLAYDQAFVDTRDLERFLHETEKKVALLYYYTPSVLRFYKDFKFYFIDKWGRSTPDKNKAVEVIVANF